MILSITILGILVGVLGVSCARLAYRTIELKDQLESAVSTVDYLFERVASIEDDVIDLMEDVSDNGIK
jgi:hypothetical protein